MNWFKRNATDGLHVNISVGFYLSVSAVKDLCLLPPDFPLQISCLDSREIAKEITKCTDLHREPIPPMLSTILFLPKRTYRHLLK